MNAPEDILQLRQDHRALHAMVMSLQVDVLALQQRDVAEAESHAHPLTWHESIVTEQMYGIAENGDDFCTVGPARTSVDGPWSVTLYDPAATILLPSKSEAIAEAQRRYVQGLQN
jgi:hypothetical protein